ncbi:MAG: adenylate/guanylate cyclase domain-containing protein [Alphaproteobacteria bacterium]|nr:adenylate/guanylate cyclase domain-containing protein [Alphaproteobacteria bacterium]
MHRLDPAPRSYPPFVWLVRRAAGFGTGPAGPGSAAETEAWLLGAALHERDMVALFGGLISRLIACGLPLERASLHVGTLHPQLLGFAWNWSRSDGLVDEVWAGGQAREGPSYTRNPLFDVIEHGREVRARGDDPQALARFPLVAELARSGISEYLALPIGGGGGQHNAATLATRRPGGFRDEEIAVLRRMLALFGLHVERHIAWRIAGNVLEAYLGAAAGRQVLEGAIKRGSGRPIGAVIWVSDLRGYTDLSDRLKAPDMLVLLNHYFELLAGAVLARGGEVLKFMGDGLLAVFPLDGEGGPVGAAARALDAAREVLRGLARFNGGEAPADLARIEGWCPLGTGIALHLGEVFFGNVGAPERLDFTVIGPAVNVASRIEALCKGLGEPVLLTAPVARLLRLPLRDLGRHRLKGVGEPVAVFAPLAERAG